MPPASKKTGKHVYDESKIKTLSSLEHIRKRTGMYIGRTGDGSHYEDGIYVLVKEVVDNAVDEFIMGHGRQIDVSVEDGKVTVRDYGRGIPLGKVVECVSRINTGAKYNDDVFQFSVGLNGVGTKAVNALSRRFLARSHRNGKAMEARFERGRLKSKKNRRLPREPEGTVIEFTPDSKIFPDFEFREDHLERRLQLYAYLNAGLQINFNGRVLLSKDGLLDLVQAESHFERLYEPFHFRDKMLELAFTHTNRFNEEYMSFVNGQYTTDGGTHLSAFREGLLKGINEFARSRFDGNDVREGILAAIAIRLKDPIFESQTKNKLGNTELRASLVSRVREVVADLLHRNRKRAERLIEKIEDTRKLRRELHSIKKMARERARTVSVRIPQLRDSKVHFNRKRNSGLESMIFITEGQSAAGSLVSCRDANTQAVFTLKGKPLNVCDLKRDALYKNTELYNLMRSLNVEDSVEALRYRKVILATDADVDGLHIRNLMITFFLRFFEPLVREECLYILETPLFRVRTRQETRYCYSEADRNAAARKLGRGCEITRFKGLGEISPPEFKAFISEDMRLTPVTAGGDHSIPEVIGFYMGKNTRERRRYIMDNLVNTE
jgi:DNA gyrase subunit B/topoisomerase-4 subunit B